MNEMSTETHENIVKLAPLGVARRKWRCLDCGTETTSRELFRVPCVRTHGDVPDEVETP